MRQWVRGAIGLALIALWFALLIYPLAFISTVALDHIVRRHHPYAALVPLVAFAVVLVAAAVLRMLGVPVRAPVNRLSSAIAGCNSGPMRSTVPLMPFVLGGAFGVDVWTMALLVGWLHPAHGSLWVVLPVVLAQPAWVWLRWYPACLAPALVCCPVN